MTAITASFHLHDSTSNHGFNPNPHSPARCDRAEWSTWTGYCKGSNDVDIMIAMLLTTSGQ